jgi:hypothetical protein
MKRHKPRIAPPTKGYPPQAMQRKDIIKLVAYRLEEFEMEDLVSMGRLTATFLALYEKEDSEKKKVFFHRITLELLEEEAKKRAGGHFTVMRFTTNWRVGFGTPSDREDIDQMHVGPTFEEAAWAALEEPKEVYDRREKEQCERMLAMARRRDAA